MRSLIHRIVNKFMKNAGPKTIHFPSMEEMDIFDCSQRYKSENVSQILLVGKEYGSGSSRDWAAKGPFLLGIKAVIAESYERIHRSNLVGMGVIRLIYLNKIHHFNLILYHFRSFPSNISTVKMLTLWA